MKVQPQSASIRITMSASEAARLATICRDAATLGAFLTESDQALVAQLDRAAADVRMNQHRRRADRQATERAESRRREREAFGQLDGCNWTAVRADYADAARDPDFRQWVDIDVAAAIGRPSPDQCEIRRDVWLVRVTRPIPGDISSIIGSDCTESADRRAIEPLVRSMLAAEPSQRNAA